MEYIDFPRLNQTLEIVGMLLLMILGLTLAIAVNKWAQTEQSAWKIFVAIFGLIVILIIVIYNFLGVT